MKGRGESLEWMSEITSPVGTMSGSCCGSVLAMFGSGAVECEKGEEGGEWWI